jgi:hypothetical protein
MLRLKQPERILRIVCYAFAAVLVFELARAVMRLNPLSGVALPAVPSLTTDSETPAKGTNAPAVPETGKKETNSATLAKPRNAESNALVSVDVTGKATNSAPVLVATNIATNLVSLETVATNAAARPVTGEKMGTNSAAAPPPGRSGTNIAALTEPGKMGAPARPDAKKPAELPPVIQARVDRIIDSEILAPVMRPMPMALLGIAGNVAFLRAPSGQTGLVKEGDDLGGIKLLRIGTNRVLVEEQGQKKELTIFSGYGGDSLLPKQETPK